MANDLRARRGKPNNGGGRNEPGNLKRLDELKKVRGKFDLNSVDGGVLLGAIIAAINGGGALRIGVTRDRGALAIGVYVDGGSETVYLNKDDDPRTFWLAIYQTFDPDWTEEMVFGVKNRP